MEIKFLTLFGEVVGVLAGGEIYWQRRKGVRKCCPPHSSLVSWVLPLEITWGHYWVMWSLPPHTHTPPKCFGSVLRRKEHQEWKGSDCHESHPKALGRIRKFGPDRSSWLDLILVTWSYHCCKITKFWTLICVWFISLSTAVNCFYQGLNSYLFNGWVDMAKIIWHELVCVHIAHMKSGN